MLQLKLSLLWLLPSQTLFDWNQTKTTLYVFTQVLEIKQKPGVKCIPLDSKHASPSELWALLHLQVGFFLSSFCCSAQAKNHFLGNATASD